MAVVLCYWRFLLTFSEKSFFGGKYFCEKRVLTKRRKSIIMNESYDEERPLRVLSESCRVVRGGRTDNWLNHLGAHSRAGIGVGECVSRVKGKRMTVRIRWLNLSAKRVVPRVEYTRLFENRGDGQIVFESLSSDKLFLVFMVKTQEKNNK